MKQKSLLQDPSNSRIQSGIWTKKMNTSDVVKKIVLSTQSKTSRYEKTTIVDIMGLKKKEIWTR